MTTADQTKNSSKRKDDSNDYVGSALRTINIEAEAVAALGSRVDTHFEKACALLIACKGRIVVTGMGKSGHIANKIAATFASTGSPAFFVHPAEASHGDLGMITRDDVVVALSNSGNTEELTAILPLLKRLSVPLIAMTGNTGSTLAQRSDVHLDASVATEACPHNLAPTTSTTVALVLGDALAIALLEARGFSTEDYAFSHPGGALGKRLLLKVEDVMRTGAAIPRVSSDTRLSEVLLEISNKSLGMTTVVAEDDTLLGVFTDGDLRRALDQGIDYRSALISDLMNAGTKTIVADELAATALSIMEDHKITVIVVVDNATPGAAKKPVGVVHMHDLLQAGLA